MDSQIKVLMIDSGTGFYKINRFKVGDYFGPVDLGLHLSAHHNSLNIGPGLFAGSIFPGSNRLVFSGFTQCWGGFYISSMGGAGLVFDDLGINMLSIVGKAGSPSILYLNRMHGEEIEVEVHPVNIQKIWNEGRGGVYSLLDYALNRYGEKYENDPRILAVGPSALSTDFGSVVSVPVKKGENTHVDTWAGRGGFGSKLMQEHGICAVIYGGTAIDIDFRDRKVADAWFEQKYNKKLAVADIDATTKYRYDPNLQTGGTLGVNFATLGGRIMAFNYKTVFMEEQDRLDMHQKLVVDHYLKQFNEETIEKKQQANCGEPCAAVCKKMNNEFKKDYEPYQTMGPLCGIFDQRAAELLNHTADTLGFDAISIGGVLSWLLECLDENLLTKEELNVSEKPIFSPEGFAASTDSMHNAKICIELLKNIIEKKGILNFENGARSVAQNLSASKGRAILDKFVYNAYARRGWMVPNQYWTPGALSPMAIMGKYYMYYGTDFIPPRELGRKNAERMQKELILDNLGFCRFHRGWAEDMMPDIIESLYGKKELFLSKIHRVSSRINARNSSVFWESQRNIDFVYAFLKRKQTIDNTKDSELIKWIEYFERDKNGAAMDFWYEIHKGTHETLKEF
ncbi:MAG: aldehyde ferredoxin oxidoreductase [Bacteroidetes bacterium RIFOXYA12_FULL_35_11]|nr:MAG: aldehyde ferredoxin oxidoreductase [Bacteroidetes bacterium GWF2_35_48]OFY74631.1 MAG: aldehyde ferredoxin oxidoreductase [Bacteroidetes bacterium RIFOXYA12_FULL_35_11]HBX52717.1 aldehyde ferredoxin oxidoreductase [Bacteroidales bacterium]